MKLRHVTNQNTGGPVTIPMLNPGTDYFIIYEKSVATLRPVKFMAAIEKQRKNFRQVCRKALYDCSKRNFTHIEHV